MFNFFKKTKNEITLSRDKRCVYVTPSGDWSTSKIDKFYDEDLEKLSAFISKHTNLSDDSILSILNIFLGDKYEFFFKENK